jgi:hypothetical protein
MRSAGTSGRLLAALLQDIDLVGVGNALPNPCDRRGAPAIATPCVPIKKAISKDRISDFINSTSD